MIHFVPFRALLPNKSLAESIVTKPFDSYQKSEIEKIVTSNPHSFLNIIVPVHDQFEKKQYSYEQILSLGKQNMLDFISQGTLVKENEPAYFVYRQTSSKGIFTGFIGAASIDDYLTGKIKKHEETLEHKEELLKQYLETVDIHAEPVYLIYPENEFLKNTIESTCESLADFTIRSLESEKHELWLIRDYGVLIRIRQEFEKMDSLYIADGHHRSAASSLYGTNKRKENPNYTGKEPFNFFMAAALSESEARLYEFSRLVKTDEGFDAQTFLRQLQQYFEITPIETSCIPNKMHEFGLYIDQAWYRLRLKAENIASDKAYDNLDPQLLNAFLFGPILGITDLRKDKRVSFIGGKCNPALLEDSVNSGKYKMAFTVYSVSMSQFKAIADAGIPMPPKSTYFEPKFPNALVIYPLHE